MLLALHLHDSIMHYMTWFYTLQGPAIPMIRRHTKGDGEIHFEPALRVISGNYITAKRRGVVDGVDFGYTGGCGNWGCGAHGAALRNSHQAGNHRMVLVRGGGGVRGKPEVS
jgi:hypothetical protein